MSAHHLSCPLKSARATTDCAVRLAPRLRPGDVILLAGDVGAGKTHFARSLIQSLLSTPENVPSPTFTLVQTYDTTKGEIWHADLYRLVSTQEVEELGLTEAFDTAISLVEWPDRLGSMAPPTALSLTFRMAAAEGMRDLAATWNDSRWTDRLAGWLP